MNMVDITIIAGIAIGSLMLLTVSAAYFRHGTFGLGGVFLTVFGVVLIGIALWRSISVQIDSAGTLEAKFITLERETVQIRSRNEEIIKTTSKLVENSPGSLTQGQKICSVYGTIEDNWRDSFIVPTNWTVEMCLQYKEQILGNRIQLGCAFEDGMSFAGSRNNAFLTNDETTVPARNCGW
ncbi:MAG: hypothetical protein AAGA11_21595 [Pseudomonadota bacterium]